MKLIKYIYKVSLCGLMIFLSSCTDDFEEINTDPNKFKSPSPGAVFNGAIRNTYLHIGGELNNEVFLTYGGYIGQRGGALGNFSFFEPQLNTLYQKNYTDIIVTLRNFIDENEENSDFTNRVEIAKVWETYVYSVLVSTFGPVPYSDAIGENLTVKFDSEETIYQGMLETLKNASDRLDINEDRFEIDPIYQGDINKWIRFSNSLRLKIALRISNSSELKKLAETHITEVMLKEDQMIENNEQNVQLKGEIGNNLNWSYAYQKFVFNQNIGIGQIPTANFHFLLNLKTFNDPRLEIYHDLAKDSLAINDSVLKSGSTTEYIKVSYKIPYYGKTVSGNQTLGEWGLNQPDNPYEGVADDGWSRPNYERYFAEDASFNVITAAETYFMKAEAKYLGLGGAETSEAYYYKGIDASFEQYEVSSKVETYKNKEGVKWGTSNSGIRDVFGVLDSSISSDPLDQIVRQRWIAMFYQGHDAWCLNKRTRLIPTQPHYNPDNTVSARPTIYAEIPERLPYAPAEKGSNINNYNEALEMLGGPDDLITPLKMNKPFIRVPDLTTIVDAEYNSDFASNWYGKSEDDLIANGVSYTVITE
ncbi:SusD/RagB family nutrient-binding outer membrane lipoprotein [Ochrovirga pacifica]|uniref:SusD/RagB family nutrient-binding outer membrane lipoprotein n=1 Tax=Ochrovirga pacifica TaxID=1042376 RepID=UPI00135F1442|nr:SusD/RagB family nutrient-binding outer membrane lipoprotein [Ochrovirga pacifica]